MDDQTTVVIVSILIIAFIIGIIHGAIKTFQRNWIAALLLLIFVFPIWVFWAIIEMFTGPIVSEPLIAPSSPVSQNVNVTVVNQSDGTVRRIENGDQSFQNVIDTSTQPHQDVIPAAPAPLGYVHVKKTNQRYEIFQSHTTIGRAAPSHIQITDSSISRQHVALRIQGHRVFVSDLNSTNGTKVNGRRIGGEVEIQSGATITAGQCDFVYLSA